MRELTYYIAVSLDGRIAAPDGAFDAFPVEGDHIDMIFREYRDTLPGVGLEMIGAEADNARFDTILMGWDTYAIGGLPDPYPHLRQYVFTREHLDAEVPSHITVTDDDPVDVVRRLKAEETGSGIYLCGGGVLAGALVDEIDRLVLKVNPVVLGDGIPLFAGGGYDPHGFELTAATPYASGVVVTEYARAAR